LYVVRGLSGSYLDIVNTNGSYSIGSRNTVKLRNEEGKYLTYVKNIDKIVWATGDFGDQLWQLVAV
jgi:hypothetical protein